MSGKSNEERQRRADRDAGWLMATLALVGAAQMLLRVLRGGDWHG